MGVSHSLYEHELEKLKASRSADLDTDLTTEDLKELVGKYKSVYRNAIGKDFPTGKYHVLLLMIERFHEWFIQVVTCT